MCECVRVYMRACMHACMPVRVCVTFLSARALSVVLPSLAPGGECSSPEGAHSPSLLPMGPTLIYQHIWEREKWRGHTAVPRLIYSEARVRLIWESGDPRN